MPTDKLTSRKVEAVSPQSSDYFLWDTDLPGFGLKVTPTGCRVYLVQYRIGGRRGVCKRVTLGKHGRLTTHLARQQAAALLAQVTLGVDPAEEKRKLREQPTISELCKLYVAEGCTTKKPGTVLNDRSRIKRHIEPLLGSKRASQVTRADVERFLADVAAGKTATSEKTGRPRGRAIVKGGKGIASRTVELLGAIIEFAIARGVRADNPVRKVKKFARAERGRFLTAAQMEVLGSTLADEAQAGKSLSAIAAIRLLLLTGARKSEILKAKWEWVDFEKGLIRLPDSKTGPRIIPLAAPALAVLSSLPKIEGNPHVLPGLKSGGHLVGLQKFWKRICKNAGLEGFRIHDLRHSFASVVVDRGGSLYLLGKVLGHQRTRTTEVYAHVSNDPVKATAQSAAAQIAAAMKVEPAPRAA